jgi:PqqD family protein of HPr-rel-A system
MVRLSEVTVNDQGFVFDPATGTSFTVNASGVLILRALREGLDAGAVAGQLCASFGIEPARAERDVAVFLRELAAQGLASGVEAAAGPPSARG